MKTFIEKLKDRSRAFAYVYEDVAHDIKWVIEQHLSPGVGWRVFLLVAACDAVGTHLDPEVAAKLFSLRGQIRGCRCRRAAAGLDDHPRRTEGVPSLRRGDPLVAGSALKILDASPGSRLFKTPEEADEYLRNERDSWER
jgi:hypothetical protein